MGMLGSLQLNTGLFQPVPLPFWNYRMDIWRKSGTDDNSGPMGTNPETWKLITKDFPCQLIPLKGDVEYMRAGLTERAEYLILAPYSRLTDGTLVIRERDALYDPLNNLYHLVLYTEESLHNQQIIMGWVEQGIINLTLSEQN